MGRPTGRPPGRPPGTPDLRPKIIKHLLRSRILDVAVEHLARSLEGHISAGRTREADQLSIELVKAGIQLSPRTSEYVGDGPRIELVINGFRSRDRLDEADPVVEVQSAPVPRALPAPAVASSDSRAKSPYVSSTPRSRPVVDPTPLVEDDRPRFPTVRIPHGPPERSAIPSEWRGPIFGSEE